MFGRRRGYSGTNEVNVRKLIGTRGHVTDSVLCDASTNEDNPRDPLSSPGPNCVPPFPAVGFCTPPRIHSNAAEPSVRGASRASARRPWHCRAPPAQPRSPRGTVGAARRKGENTSGGERISSANTLHRDGWVCHRSRRCAVEEASIAARSMRGACAVWHFRSLPRNHGPPWHARVPGPGG